MNKTIIGLIIAGILLISIPVGVRLVQQQQILKSKAAVVYNNPCGDAQKCADPETEGDPGRILCTNSCGTATNSCRTERSCGTPIGCQSKDDCTQNVSCPTGCTGTEVLCDTGVEGGICYSSCTCPNVYPACGNNPPGTSQQFGQWIADCNGKECTGDMKSNNCLKNTFDRANINPDSSSWCYQFSEGSRCLILVRPPCLKSGDAGCSGSGGGAAPTAVPGGGSCPLDPKFQTPSLNNTQLACVLRKNSGLVNAIKNAIDQPSNPSRYISCTDLQLVNFWCNNDIGRQNCANDKDSCGAVGGPGPSGAGLSCAVSGDLTITRGSKPTFVAKPTSSLVKSLELSYNFGDKYNKDDWHVLNSCSAGLVEGCQGEIDASLDKIPESVKQFIVKCDGFSTLNGVARIYSPSTSCSGNPVVGTNIGDTNSDYPGWSYCGPDSNKTITLKAAVAPTAAPTPTPARPTPSPTPTACKTQVRFSADKNKPWDTTKTITLGSPIYIAGFNDNQTDTAVADIDIRIDGPTDNTSGRNHSVPPPALVKDANNIFTYTVPNEDGAGKYTITAVKSGVDCVGIGTGTGAGKATLTVTAPVATTVQYRVSENKADFTLADNNPVAPWVPYTDGILANYLIRDRNPGQKYIYVEFEDSNKVRGGCGFNNKPTTSTKLEDRKYPCMMPIQYLDSGRISNCSISIDGSNTILNLTGNNFGTTAGSVKGTTIAGSTEGTGLTPITWEDNLVSVKWSNAPQGKTLYVTLITANKQKMPGTCSPVSQLALSTKVFCQAISTTNCAKDNVNLVIKDVASGDIVINKTVSINTDGVVTGLNQKLEAGKKYILSMKAPKSLRRNREFEVKTGTGGTTNISDFVLPLGDINTLGGKGDGKIAGSDYALMVRDWNISTDTGDRPGDVDCNRRVNSRDWACLVYDYGKESDPELVPGVELTNPNATPVPGTTGTPAPGQPGACTLGMYVRFEGINNAAFSAHPVVSLGLYPPGSTIRPGTIPPAEPLGYNLSSGTVSVTSSTVPTHQQDVFLITSGTKQLTCGETYDVVVMSSGYKLSRFLGVKVVDNPSLYPTFFFNNEPICLKTAGGCNYKCLENDPCCPFTTGSPIPANNCVVQ